MVGESQARTYAKDKDDLLQMFRTRKIEARQKAAETKKMIVELERELAALDAEENAWDTAIFELEHVGLSSGPKKRGRKKESEEEEEIEEEE